MSVAFDLKKMSKIEKIQAMESLWEDLCQTAGESLSPDWHEEVLIVREGALQQGESSFTDWNTAKKLIRESIK